MGELHFRYANPAKPDFCSWQPFTFSISQPIDQLPPELSSAANRTTTASANLLDG